MRILSIIGARPQFIKAAVFRKRCLIEGIEEILVHTGQHYDLEMSLGIFNDLKIKQPDIIFKLKNRSHAGMTAECLSSIEEVILEKKPDLVNVYGDTNSTLAGALAAAKLNIPIMHIEAGLRSFNKAMPEEVNRILTDHVSEFLFCPTKEAVKNLMNENITKGVFHVGDIMLDAVDIFSPFFRFPEQIIKKVNRKLAILTVHRAETVNNPNLLKKVLDYSRQYCGEYDVVFPIHPNTKNKVEEYKIELNELVVTKPLSYLEMQGLLKESDLVLTDSGGLQKEAYFHGCDCITLRDETEWVETIEYGWNKIWTETNYKEPKEKILDFGDGNSAGKMLQYLLEKY